MEHAQRDTLIKNESVVYGSLNPCFSGTCSKKFNQQDNRVCPQVLILVLVEHAQRVTKYSDGTEETEKVS